MQPIVISESPITISELKEGIDKIKKRDSEPSFRVTRTDEYLQAFSSLSNKQAAELVEKINKLNVPRLKDVHVCKIVDLMPTDPNDLKMILQSYTLTVSNDNIKKVADLIKEYAK